MKRYAQVLGILTLLVGCTTSRFARHSYVRHSPIGPLEVLALKRDQAILIATPRDVTHEYHTYKGSGAATARQLSASFAQHANRVAVLPRMAKREAIQASIATGRHILVYPEILKWEDHDAIWTGQLDRIKLRVWVISIETGEPLAKVTLEGSGAFDDEGEDCRPQDLLEGPISQWVSGMYYPKLGRLHRRTSTHL